MKDVMGRLDKRERVMYMSLLLVYNMDYNMFADTRGTGTGTRDRLLETCP